MRQNLLNAGVAKQSIERVNALKPTLVPLWGSMSVTMMLHHFNRVLTATLEGKPSGKGSTIRQKVLKFVFLHLVSRFPKNVAAPKKLQVLIELPADTFEKEKEECIRLINAFAGTKYAIGVAHPTFGKLNTREWGYFTWMHLDHHLRQFGL